VTVEIGSLRSTSPRRIPDPPWKATVLRDQSFRHPVDADCEDAVDRWKASPAPSGDQTGWEPFV
jgi:hypothetical protein